MLQPLKYKIKHFAIFRYAQRSPQLSVLDIPIITRIVGSLVLLLKGK